jgi:hypothetical protein
MRTTLLGRRHTVVELYLVLIPVVFSACASAALPPEPSNAALLYYQAMLCAHEPNRAMKDLIGEAMAWGAQPPGEQIREYVEDWRDAIRFVEVAAKIADCDWGRSYSGGGDAFGLTVLNHLRELTRVLCLGARILAADGKYRESLERCLTIHTLARHIGNETSTPSTLIGWVEMA